MIERFISNLSLPFQIVSFLLVLAVGAIVLIKCCDVFLNNATIVAQKFRISKIIIGLTIVSIGTSIPELSVCLSDAIFSAIEGSNSTIGFSNVVGSNISNILLVLSFGCLFAPIIIKKENKIDYFIMLFVTLMLLIFSFFFGGGKIQRWESMIILSFMIFYIIYIVYNAKMKMIEKVNEEEKNIKILKPIILIILCVAGIAIGGDLVVEGAKGVALNISDLLSVDKDMAETLVGLTIVGVGTSLPELVTTFMSAKKGENEIALGNVIGSNILNIILILGLSGIVSPYAITSYMLVDLLVLMFATLLVMVFVFRGKLTKKHSYLFIAVYLSYLVYLFVRI